MGRTVIDGTEWWAKDAPDKQAVVFEGDSLTYAELKEWSDRAAADLASRGIEPGDRVGILAANSIEYCVAVIAAMKAGAVVVPMNNRLTPKELAALTTSSEPKLVFTDDEFAETTAATAKEGPNFEQLAMSELAALRQGDPVEFGRPEVDPAEPAALIYTSGTTGSPKGVIFTNDSILGFITEFAMTEPGFRFDMRQLMPLPLGGAPGTIWGIIHVFVRGGTMFLEKGFHPEGTLKALAEHRITCMLGVPVLFEQMAAQDAFADADLSAWDTATVGGARVSEQLLKTYGEKGVILRQIYGMTEAGGLATTNPRSAAEELPEYCGYGNMFSEIKVVRDDGTECDPGEPGEIIMRCPGMTPGYWRNEEETAKAIVEGWLHSGDVGEMNEDGFVKMVERKKDLIISGGLNISPAEIENAIVELPEVEEVAVIAAADEKFGETPAAVIKADGDLTAETVVEHCNKGLADFKVPRYVIFTDEPLPRMASGKIAKRMLRETHDDIAGTHEKVR